MTSGAARDEKTRRKLLNRLAECDLKVAAFNLVKGMSGGIYSRARISKCFCEDYTGAKAMSMWDKWDKMLTSPVTWAVAGLALVLAYTVWPTPYRYETTKSSSGTRSIEQITRISRITGEAEVLSAGGWRKY